MVAMLATALSAGAYDFKDDNGLCYKINYDGTTVTVTYETTSSPSYNSLSGAVVIPETVTYEGTTYTVNTIDRDAFRGCKNITSLTVAKSIEFLNSYAFEGCTGLTTLTWNAVRCYFFDASDGPDSNDVFTDCSSLTSLVFGDDVEWFSDEIFFWSPSLKSVVIGNSMTNIDYGMFSGCTSLMEVTIGNSVTEIGSFAFNGCSSLASITIPDAVTYIGDGAFNGCSSLADVTIPSSVETVGYDAFAGCSSLKSVTWNAINCNLNFRNSGFVTYYTSPFNGSDNLETFTFGKDVTSIPGYLCNSLSSLSSIYALMESPETITYGEGIFTGVNKSTCEVIVPEGSLEQYKATAPWNEFANLGGQVPPPYDFMVDGLCYTYSYDGPFSSSYYDDYVFVMYERNPYDENNKLAYSAYSNLNGEVEIPDHVTYEGTEYKVGFVTSRTFANCTGLTSVIMNVGTEYDFSKCPFEGCTALSSVTIGPSVGSLSTKTFVGCTGLTKITWNAKDCSLDGGEDDYYDVKEEMFGSEFPTISSFVFGDEVETIPGHICQDLTGLKSLTIGNSVNHIGYEAFSGCSGLTSIESKIENPEDVDYDDYYYIFYNVNKNACKVIVPKGTLAKYKATAPWNEFFNIEEEGSGIVGDVNGDEVVSGADVTTLYNVLLDGATPAGDADVNGDGFVNGADVTALYNLLLEQ